MFYWSRVRKLPVVAYGGERVNPLLVKLGSQGYPDKRNCHYLGLQHTVPPTHIKLQAVTSPDCSLRVNSGICAPKVVHINI